MANTQVQLRRGTTAGAETAAGAEGEITYDTDLLTIRAHDGLTLGGAVLASRDWVTEQLAATASGNATNITLALACI